MTSSSIPSDATRHRRIAGGFPPTSEATNEIRRKCIDLLREALGLPALRLGGGEIPLQPAPEAATLSALSRQLDRYLGGAMSPAQTRLTALLAVELDTAARSGELVVALPVAAGVVTLGYRPRDW
ncbi:hypothetical protein [Streptomyces sp. NBC_01320]|uniref:hypothetical protein n=1 Tax=Streptomyces sp. NBC_01320 TaxID=2903824 RepID=UPI002E0E6758|nr:hypothetical protein OG395_47810 [Streptomyces sp. NBC_01320]